MKRKFTKYPSTSIQASFKKPEPKYDTVGDLIQALSKFPSDYPVKVIGAGFGINEPDNDLCFIKDITDYDTTCTIEIV